MPKRIKFNRDNPRGRGHGSHVIQRDPRMAEAARIVHNAQAASRGSLPPATLRFACARCGRARRAIDLVINPLNAGQMLCKSEAACDKELALVQRLVKQEWGVALPGSKAQTISVPTGGTTDGGQDMPSGAVGPNPSYSTPHARQLIKDGASPARVRELTGFGIGTIQRLKKEPDWEGPDPKISEVRRKQWADGGRARAKVEERDTPEYLGSLKTRILQALMDNRDKPFLNVFDVRRAVAQPSENIDGHKVNHILFDLRTAGWVRFVESRGGKAPGTRGTAGSQNVITDIKLSGQGWRLGQVARWNAQVALRGAAPEVAPTVPVNGTPAPEEAVVAPAPTPAPEPQPAPELREDHFPLMRALIMRPAKVKAAATLLREAGMEAAATLIEQEVTGLSPLEQEVVAYFTSHPLTRE